MASLLEGLAQAALGGTAQVAQAAAEDWKTRANAAREQAFRKEGWEAEAAQRKDMLKEETAARRGLAQEEMAGRKELSTMELQARKEEGAADRGSRAADRAAMREDRAATRSEEREWRKEQAAAAAAQRGQEVTRVIEPKEPGEPTKIVYKDGTVLMQYPAEAATDSAPAFPAREEIIAPPQTRGAQATTTEPQKKIMSQAVTLAETEELGLSGASAMMYGQARQKYPDVDPKVLLQGLKSDPRTKVYFPD